VIPEAFEKLSRSSFSHYRDDFSGYTRFFCAGKAVDLATLSLRSCDAHGDDGEVTIMRIVTDDMVMAMPVAGALIILGDSIHNFVDGVLIAAAFLTDVQLGIVTSLAVAAHEIPQEVGDFAILLDSGYSRGKALFYNVLASLTTVLGGVLAYFSLEDLHDSLPYFLALAASSFIYIAVADLIPSLHTKTDMKTSLQQIALIAAGVF